ncbi:hypothetical protein [Oceanicola sp. S124]|uniref:hypothetical protein n=1 Tax=Oceanicola sp. S124 TaxID=1042378 RepID=UPI0002559C83|nr:hypothetical protein [Oceanicola sp. S124]
MTTLTKMDGLRHYRATVTEELCRHYTIPAGSAAEAERMARRSLKPGQKLVGINVTDGYRSAETGADCLAHLLGHPYFPAGDVPRFLADWIRAALGWDGAEAQAANRQLAYGGLRIRPETPALCVASGRSVAFLVRVFEDTPWADRWADALAALPGASRTNMTFARVASRAVQLPLAGRVSEILDSLEAPP